MPEPVSAGWLLGAALVSSVVGMGWLALAMQAHALQVWGATVSLATVRMLRVLGASGLAVALSLCLAADHASMAVLVWVMALAGAALLVAFTLAWRAHWLRVLAPWVRAGMSPGRQSHAGR